MTRFKYTDRSETKKLNLDQDRVPAEELKLFHSSRVHRHDGVIIVDGLVDDETIGRLLAL